ncbi:hypothetical protein GCM10009104_25650 [Marinobacterium maritimum]|uniref:Tyr recombinase domain-containing protein n=1 Tax=Marinobacterium maritimum TaxID=500162 RepID=A0ABP3TEV5_9GAMM
MTESKQELVSIAKQWASDWYHDLIEHDLCRGPLTREEAETHEEIISDWLSEARERYALNKLDKAASTARTLIDGNIDEDDISFKLLCQEITKQTIAVYERLHAKVSSGAVMPDTLHPEDTSAAISATKKKPQPKRLVSSVYKEYAAEKIKLGEWSRQRTQNENDLSLRMFTELVGDLDIAQIDKEHGRAFKEKLLRYPAQREKLAALKDLPIDAILEGEQAYETISIRTAHNRFVKVTAFLNWATSNGYIESNPLSGMGIKINKNKKDSRKPFSESDLKSIFSSPVFTQGKHKHDYYYWLPLIGLYTGARIEEICQMNLHDIREDNGTLCFHITDEGEHQQLKNASSRRVVPVHPKLLDLGLLRYIEQRRAAGAVMLLPSLEKVSERYSHNPVKWFGRFKKQLGITDTAKTFHSFRHSFIDHLRAAHAPDYAIKEIVGHTDESATHAVYGSRNAKPLKPVIESIFWDNAVVSVMPFRRLER